MLRFTWHGRELEKRWNTAAQAASLAMAKFTAQLCQEAVSVPYPPASQPGEPPHLRTGTGRDSIVARPDPTQANTSRLVVLPQGWYMVLLEQGTERIAARPWLVPTLVQYHGDIYNVGSATFLRHMQ